MPGAKTKLGGGGGHLFIYAQVFYCYEHVCGIFATVTVLPGIHWVSKNLNSQ